MNRKLLQLFLCCLVTSAPLAYADDNPIRIGTLKFGTVNWELDVVKRYGLDREQGINLAITPFSNNQTSKIAFQGNEVDMIVSDWVWVSLQRYQGNAISFIPYSTALGAVMVPPQSQAASLKDLKNLRFGVAGGSYDKSWLLLRVWAQKHYGFDPDKQFDVQYAAPPLLNGHIEHDNLDVVLNFWHYCARLEAQGYKRLVEMQTIMDDFVGNDVSLPMVGYVFKDNWATRGQIEKFNAALRKAREILLSNDDEWEKLRPLMRAADEATFYALRDRYRAGIPRLWGELERKQSKKLFNILSAIADANLTGGHSEIADGTFWKNVRY